MNIPTLPAALRACADGLYALEASVELLIAHARWLDREDFVTSCIRTGTSITDGITEMALIDWPAAITALHTGELPCSSGEQKMLQLAASLADQIPVNLGAAITGLDNRNIQLLIRAILHASGRRQFHDHLKVQRIIGQRLKQSGMRWTVAGADAIIALRCTEASSACEPVCLRPRTQTGAA